MEAGLGIRIGNCAVQGIAWRGELRGSGICVARGIAQLRELRGAGIRHNRLCLQNHLPITFGKWLFLIKTREIFP